MLLGVVDEFMPNWTAENTESKKIRLDYEDTALCVYLEGDDGDANEGFFQLLCRSKDYHLYPSYYCGTDTYYGEGFLPLSLNITEDSRSKAAFERVSNWLSFCLDHDEGCKVADSVFKPRRLLSVGSSEEPHNMHLFEPDRSVTYACLSYCWGTDLDGVLKTTKGNLPAHLARIEFDSLPKTIADAVTVCRELKIPNLWVDSLCIIQDDQADWVRESSQMLDIYTKSYLTIYAKEPSSCKSGFLGSQRYGDPRWQRPIKTPPPPELSLPGDEFFIRENTRYPKESSFALHTRAWCLQESLMPNRKLFFDGNEMSWECCTRRICECGHLAEMDICHWDSWTLLRLKDLLGLAKISPATRYSRSFKKDPLEDWENLVVDYSTRNMTNGEDKLSAISGLARMMLEAKKIACGEPDRYHAGLWASSLISGLSWQTSGGKRQAKYRAPTWSWASIDGPITRFQRGPSGKWKYTPHRNTHVRIDEVVCDALSPSDTTGRVKGGYAVVTGPVVSVELVTLERGLDKSRADWLTNGWGQTQTSEGQISMVRSCNLRSYKVQLDFDTGPFLYGKSEQSVCWVNRGCLEGCCCGGAVAQSSDEAGFDDAKTEYACLQLYTWENYGRDDRPGRYYGGMPPDTWFLVLQKCPSGDVYNRVGIGFADARLERWPRVESEETGKRFECPLFERCEIKTIKIE
ncbi:hypothetical protein DL771_002800 [Monosporascus sp. 5C6A]|nr:hypothetical protein DL771_002800 [Monosporascus sp. 5C6A]